MSPRSVGHYELPLTPAVASQPRGEGPAVNRALPFCPSASWVAVPSLGLLICEMGPTRTQAWLAHQHVGAGEVKRGVESDIAILSGVPQRRGTEGDMSSFGSPDGIAMSEPIPSPCSSNWALQDGGAGRGTPPRGPPREMAKGAELGVSRLGPVPSCAVNCQTAVQDEVLVLDGEVGKRQRHATQCPRRACGETDPHR